MEMKFTFKIDLAEYAKRFGISLPDDSTDAITDDAENEGEAKDCACCDAIVEDANVDYAPSFRVGSLAGQCKATLAQCKAKNPMTCRYHGAKVIANDIEASLRAAGVQGQVDVNLLGITSTNGKQYLSVEANVTAAYGDEKKVKDAVDNFLKNPGVEGSSEMVGFRNKEFQALFDIDLLDPKAQAKWGAGSVSPQQSDTTKQHQATVSQSPQPASPAQKPPRPTRKRAKKVTTEADESASTNLEQVVEKGESSPDIDVSIDDNAPELYPDVRPPKPPDWTPPFDSTELATLASYAERIGKTAERLDGVLAKEEANPGYLAQYLAKGNGDQNKPNAHLPKGLQVWKNKVDVANLRALAEKDTDGQVKKMLDVAEKIDASEANGWKDKIGVAAADVEFDASKYTDPYAKERAAYESFVPGEKGRDAGVANADSVLSSKDKNAPKDAAEAVKTAHKEMSDLEEGFKTLAEAPKPILKTLAQAYHKANEKFKDGVAKCKKWVDGQSVMRNSIRDTIQGMKDRGETIPEEMLGWESVEAMVEDQAWRTIARTHGLNVADKEKHLAIYKKNMRALFRKCPCVSGYNINHVIGHILNNPDHTLHANTNSYVRASNAAFGTKWFAHSQAANNGMHTYAKVFHAPFSKMNLGGMYSSSGNDVALVYNPKKAIISYVHKYLSSLYAVDGHPDGSNATFVNDATCSGVAYDAYGTNKDMFTTDLSHMPMSKIQNAMGLQSSSGEAWAVGGLKASQCLAIRECGDRNDTATGWNRYFSPAEVDKFNKLGITVLDRNGNVIGKNCVPEDPELESLVWGSSGRPK